LIALASSMGHRFANHSLAESSSQNHRSQKIQCRRNTQSILARRSSRAAAKGRKVSCRRSGFDAAAHHERNSARGLASRSDCTWSRPKHRPPIVGVGTAISRLSQPVGFPGSSDILLGVSQKVQLESLPTREAFSYAFPVGVNQSFSGTRPKTSHSVVSWP